MDLRSMKQDRTSIETRRRDVGRGPKLRPKPHWVWVILAVVVGLVTLQRALGLGLSIADTHTSLANSAAQVKFEAAIAHLQFEEVLADEAFDDVYKVWHHLDKAVSIASWMHEAGMQEEGNEEFLAMTDAVIQYLVVLRTTGEKRLEMRINGGVHGDPHFDAIFDILIGHCEALETSMWDVVDTELASFERDQWGLFGICILLAIAGIAASLRHEKGRRYQEHALAISNDRLQHALRGADLGSWECDVTRAEIDVNSRWSEMFGLPAEQSVVTREEWAERIHPDDRESAESALADHIEGKTDSYEAKYRIQRASGGWSRILDRGRLVDSANSERGRRISGTVLDVTKDWEATSREQHLEKQVLHAQKLESLGVLAGGIAHDFGNLLMPILACADLAQMELPKDSSAREHLKEVVNAANHASDLVRQMLAYTGREQFMSMSLDLTELINNMEELLGVSVAKTISRSFELDGSLPAFIGDPTQIRQVIMNLVTNASEAIDSKAGNILIETGSMHCSQDYLAGLDSSPRLAGQEALEEGDFVFLRVTDDGKGMDSETLQRIFDPFFSTKFAGRGLGMATTLGIVSHHGGVITIDTSEERGTVVCVLLPVAAGEVPLEYKPDQVADGGGVVNEDHAGCILLAEDEPLVAAATGSMLRALGWKVILACDGQEALDLFQDHRHEIDLALVDLTMPRVDGMKVLEGLRREVPNLPVILYSAYGRPSNLPEPRAGVFTGFLRKPFAVADLKAALEITGVSPREHS